MTEEEKIKTLEDQGLIVDCINPRATNFNEKYTVYSNMPPLGKRYVIVDKDGNIIGRQG